MKRTVIGAAVLWIAIAACGGSTEERAATSTGAGAAGSGGSAMSSSTGSGNGGSVSTSASTGAGGLPDACTAPEAQACTGPEQCVLTSPSCCVCGTPELSDYVALNANYANQCTCQGPACGCAVAPNPNLAASCEAGVCAGWDVRQEDPYSACTSDADCRLRFGLACCESCQGTQYDLVAVRTDAEPLLQAAQCAPSEACDACAPQYPTGAFAQCVTGHCGVVFAN